MVCERVQALLESAIVLAVGAHRGQNDRAGAPYILHLLRVGLSFRDPLEVMAGVLHGVTLEQLSHAGFPAEVVEALGALTRRPGDDYGA